MDEDELSPWSIPAEDTADLLTVPETAALTGLAVSVVTEHARTHHLPALWAHGGAGEPVALIRVRHAREWAAAYTTSRGDDGARHVAMRGIAAMRRYLVDRPPTTDHAAAVAAGAAALARVGSRVGPWVPHVRVAALVVFCVDAEIPLSADDWTAALPVLGARVVEGLRDARGVRSHRMWWRLPSQWAVSDDVA